MHRSGWEGFVNHVTKMETELWQKDKLMEEVIDSFVISVGGTDFSDGGEDSNNRGE